MPELQDEVLPGLWEVWATQNNHRSRVYRGSTPDHVSWKLKHYSNCRPEVLVIREPGPGMPGLIIPKKKN